MSIKNVQFTVATHVAAILGMHYGSDVKSSVLASSVNAEPTFVRRTVAKLAKAGLVTTSRGKNGACTLARSPREISLLDIYRASQAPATPAIHSYNVLEKCMVSVHFKGCMAGVLDDAHEGFEARLASRPLSSLLDDIRHRDEALKEMAA
jgi:DNA-binding IscR family transcriptional regulator